MGRAIAIRWETWSGRGVQHCVLRENATQIVAEAAVLDVVDDRPFAARFRIRCDRAWRTRAVEASVVGDEQRIVLEGDGQGRWMDAAGQRRPDLDGAIDVDISITPFTNTLPIRRLALSAGQAVDLRMVYIALPDLAVTVDPQRYVCLEPHRRYRYESLDSDFAREIEVDADALVVSYPGLFRRVA